MDRFSATAQLNDEDFEKLKRALIAIERYLLMFNTGGLRSDTPELRRAECEAQIADNSRAVQAIRSKLREAEQLMPFLADPSPEPLEAVELTEADEALIEELLAAVEARPEILPPDLDLEGFKSRVELRRKLKAVSEIFSRIRSHMNHLLQSLGSPQQVH
jgi:hypothetical protein